MTTRNQPRISRIDPAEWPHRAQMAVLLGAPTAWILGSLAWPSLASLFPVAVPLVGALIWRFERARVRDIASWTVPLGIVLYLGAMLADPLGLVLSLVGFGFLAAMMFWDSARDGWLRLVAPGQYRVFRGADRSVAERIAVLDHDARQALERYASSGDRQRSVRRIEKLVNDANAMKINDAAWGRLRDLFVGWLRAAAESLKVADEEFDLAFAVMAERRAEFEDAGAALADERSGPLGDIRQAGPSE